MSSSFPTSPSSQASRDASDEEIESCFDDQLMTVRVIFEVVLTMPVAVFGLVGNGLAFGVLWRQNRKRCLSTVFVLKCIAVTDVAILLLTLLLQTIRYTDHCLVRLADYRAHNGRVYLVAYPLVFFFRLSQTWLTVLLTIDRYVAVCRPLHASAICTLQKARRHVTVLLAASLIFTLPRYWEHEAADNEHGFTASSMLSNRTYSVAYRIVAFFLVMYLLPLATLTSLNVAILRALCKADRARLHMSLSSQHQLRCASQLSSGSVVRSSSNKYAAEPVPPAISSSGRSVTVIVVVVCVVNMVTNAGTMVSHLLWSLQHSHASDMTPEGSRHVETTRRYLANVSNLLITISTSVNFIIYVMCSRNFRKDCARMITSSCNYYRRHRRSSLAAAASNRRSYATTITQRLTAMTSLHNTTLQRTHE